MTEVQEGLKFRLEVCPLRLLLALHKVLSVSYSLNLKSKNLKDFVFQFFFYVLFIATLICKSNSLKITKTSLTL